MTRPTTTKAARDAILRAAEIVHETGIGSCWAIERVLGTTHAEPFSDITIAYAKFYGQIPEGNWPAIEGSEQRVLMLLLFAEVNL